jgi:hypothetical protein
MRYQFWCTRCASLQWYSGRKSWKSENNCENSKIAEKYYALNWANPSKDKAMHERDNSSFWDESLLRFSGDLSGYPLFVARVKKTGLLLMFFNGSAKIETRCHSKLCGTIKIPQTPTISLNFVAFHQQWWLLRIQVHNQTRKVLSCYALPFDILTFCLLTMISFGYLSISYIPVN